MKKKPLTSTVKVRISRNEGFFGPGIEELLRAVEETKTVKDAIVLAEMSYSKAWKLLDRADRELGFPLLRRRKGGPKGGNCHLTPEGIDFLEKYEEMRKRVEVESEKIFQDVFKDYI
ncbi:MAG: LysR family transcriptional regulator [Tissierellia bacterium]|nr:LysR family transcriptional regulator [Tissierellia bacterium]